MNPRSGGSLYQRELPGRDDGDAPAAPGRAPGYAECEARRLLERQVEEMEAGGGTVAEAHLRTGAPAPEVVATAAELGADLIVVGSGGPHRMRRAFAATVHRAALGRESDTIVRTAPFPVLVVRGEVPFEEEREGTEDV